MPVICAVCHEKPTDSAEWAEAVADQMERESSAAERGYRAGYNRALQELRELVYDAMNRRHLLEELRAACTKRIVDGPNPSDMRLALERARESEG